MKKNIQVLLVFVLIVIVVFGVFRYVGTNMISISTPTPTSGELKDFDSGKGFTFKYPDNAKVTSQSNADGYSVTVELPFTTQYDVWTHKTFTFMVKPDGCGTYSSTPINKEINGVGYHYENPDTGSTSGMSVRTKIRTYTTQFANVCYIVEEKLSGTGTNETPKGATKPANTEDFFTQELKDMDTILQSLTFTNSQG